MTSSMIRERRFRFGAVLHMTVLSVCLLLPAASQAQTEEAAATQSAHPSAESIIEKSIEATGGRDAYKKHNTRMMKGKLEMASMNMQGTVEMYQARPGKMYTITNMQAMGTSEEGVNGDVAWQKHPMMGVKIKEGEEKIMSLRSADFDFGLNWRKHYAQVETVDKIDLDGKAVYVVKMTPPEGPVETRYYEVDSGLHVKTDLEVDTPMGKMAMEMLLSDYTDTGGVKVASKMIQRVMGQDVVVTFEEIKHNVEIPDEKFELPEDVKALIKKPETP